MSELPEGASAPSKQMYNVTSQAWLVVQIINGTEDKWIDFTSHVITDEESEQDAVTQARTTVESLKARISAGWTSGYGSDVRVVRRVEVSAQHDFEYPDAEGW